MAGEQKKTVAIPVSISTVAIGGLWQAGERRGRYRVVIEDFGWDHISSRVSIDWLAKHRVEDAMELVATVAVTELSKGTVAVGEPKFQTIDKKVTLELVATDSNSADKKKFVLDLGAPGKYRLRR